jgi:DNA-binding transcriptional LysR family regulator
MLENLETLINLSKWGTMTRTSVEMRLTQSAVSKRIAQLESYYGQNLIEKKGRKVALTLAGAHLVEKVRPHLLEIKGALKLEVELDRGEITIGVSESILSSWGPKVLGKIETSLPNLKIVVHAHRSPVVIDRVHSGEYPLGLCSGDFKSNDQLQTELLFWEPMVLIPGQLNPLNLKDKKVLKIMTIEEHSETWKGLKSQMASLPQRLVVERRLESFFSVASMALAGFGHGLVPLGVTKMLRIPAHKRVSFGGKLKRPINLIAKKTTWGKPIVSRFYQELLKCHKV